MIKNRTKALERNIWKYYVISAGVGMAFFIPIIVPFYKLNDITLEQVFIIQGIFSFATMVLEIPSGYLSDRWGRRNTLIVGSFLGVIGITIYGLGSSFWVFVIAELFFALKMSLFSGTTEALAYDTLLELGREKEFRHIEGNKMFYFLGGEAITSVVGGFLALISLRTPMLATIVPYTIIFFVCLTLIEPKRKLLKGKKHLSEMMRITKESFCNAHIRSIVILFSIIATTSLITFWFTQPYQELVGLPLGLFGILHAGYVIVGAFAAKSVHSLSQKFDDRKFLIAIAIMMMVSTVMLGLVQALWGLAFFFLSRTAWGLLAPLTSDIMNRLTTSDVRATVLSLRRFVGRGLFAILSPLIGYSADVLTLNQAILATGLTASAAVIITFLLMKPVWKTLPT